MRSGCLDGAHLGKFTLGGLQDFFDEGEVLLAHLEHCLGLLQLEQRLCSNQHLSTPLAQEYQFQPIIMTPFKFDTKDTHREKHMSGRRIKKNRSC